jgi:copper homeostasis protein
MKDIASKKIQLEVCANSVASALAAQDGGAYRVELCDNLENGGTTPSFGQILQARKLLNIKLYVLIRPRSGDFLYSDLEYEIIKVDVRGCIEAGCDGVVIGILKADGSVDKERCKALVDMAKAKGLGVTFHRAFDMTNDLNRALEDIIDIGCERVLTSGGRTTAMEGASHIAHLIEQAAGRISIMPGSGIDEHNVTDLVHFTGVGEIHSSARKNIKSRMKFENDHIIMGSNAGVEYSFDQSDTERVKNIIKLANS